MPIILREFALPFDPFFPDVALAFVSAPTPFPPAFLFVPFSPAMLPALDWLDGHFKSKWDINEYFFIANKCTNEKIILHDFSIYFILDAPA